MKNKDNILNASLATEFSQKYLAYALSTITHRALPDVRDGLKPVHRRLLYAMYLLNLGSKLQPKKSARVVGDVIGKFHPHGDQSVYDALVRLAQDFSIRYPLINGQGNFGNIDGDNAAAMRYTEAKLTEISELLLENEILKLLYIRFGINSLDANKIVLGNGISSLFASVCEFCAQNNYSLLLPDGSYGFFEATAMFYGCELISFKTYIKDDFKISAVNLEKTLAKATKPVWIFLNAPIVNPTGAKYSLEECEQIFRVAEKFKSYLIIDTIFSELEYQKEESCYNIQKLVSSKFPNLKFLLMGGLSKELSSGGLRIGFGYSASSEILMALRKNYFHQLPVTIRFAARKIFSILNSNEFGVSHHYQLQSQFLQERSKKLKLVLSETGWEVLKSYGGLFLIAKPTHILGRALNNLDDKESQLVYVTESNVCDILYKKFGLLINGPQWTRLPGFCRFVLSVSDHEFESALEKLKLFWSRIIKEG
jgi:aspartate/methionine/tyrosine aminotransferase